MRSRSRPGNLNWDKEKVFLGDEGSWAVKVLNLGMNSLFPGLVHTRQQERKVLDSMCELLMLCSKIGPLGATRTQGGTQPPNKSIKTPRLRNSRLRISNTGQSHKCAMLSSSEFLTILWTFQLPFLFCFLGMIWFVVKIMAPHGLALRWRMASMLSVQLRTTDETVGEPHYSLWETAHFEQCSPKVTAMPTERKTSSFFLVLSLSPSYSVQFHLPRGSSPLCSSSFSCFPTPPMPFFSLSLVYLFFPLFLPLKS